ncbi:Flp pilus assembly complex ATPase component TadA [Candidatus Woesearchaeota archaeon]|nr:Flp pilus assembly complex ATPase component TadA [Candidatus Woesearchaeota archaeon]
MFTKKINPGGFELIKEGEEEVMKINYEGLSINPSLEDSDECMADTIDKLVQVPSVNRIIFFQRRNFEYGYEQTQILREIANIFSHLNRQKRLIYFINSLNYHAKSNELRIIIQSILKSDPIGAYVELKRLIREEKLILSRLTTKEETTLSKNYLQILEYVFNLLDKSKLIKSARHYLDGHALGNRFIYKSIFRASITPDFMLTRLAAEVPLDAIEVDAYKIDNDNEVTIYRTKDDIKYLYHINPIEFKISEDEYDLVETARQVLSEHQPKAEEFVNPEKIRQTFFNIGRDLITELAEHKNIDLDYEKIKKLAEILVRYTVGFGLIEILLKDEKIQDISVNGPIGETSVFIVHQDFEECITNIVPSKEDGQSWATKFRIISGRPLDEANPVLDTELIVPGAKARVAIISNPLNPLGLGYSFRRHRDNPWTLPLFINNSMINSLGAGLISFLVDGNRSLLVAGTRSSGKTSFLGSIMVEIMSKYRIISVEDSVTGDTEILIRKNKKIERTTVGKLIDCMILEYGSWYTLSGHEILGNYEDTEILAMNKEGKIIWTRFSKLIRHKTDKNIYEIWTRTGRRIKVTGDHSLFTSGINAQITAFKVKDCKIGNLIAVPRQFPATNKDTKSVIVLDYIHKLKGGYLYGEGLTNFIKYNKYEIIQLGKEYGNSKCTICRWLRKNLLPINIVKDLDSLGQKIQYADNIYYKSAHIGKGLPVKIDLDETFLTFIGLWLADGCYDKKSVILSVAEPENKEIFIKLAIRFGFNLKKHSDKFSIILNSSTLKEILMNVFNLKGNAYTKRIPGWAFTLSKNQISFILKGVYSGDGCVSDKEIVMSLASRKLLSDIQTLFLYFGIILRICQTPRKDNTFRSSISAHNFWRIFQHEIGILPSAKAEKLKILCSKKSSHDTSDILPLEMAEKEKLSLLLDNFNSFDYIKRNNSIGRTKLKQIVLQMSGNDQFTSNLCLLSNSDILWDRIESIRVIENFDDYVYDFSVPECESFVCENIIAHNTLELPIEALRKLGYNIQPMKVRAALAVAGGSEVKADEGIRTSLRMGDSSLIVGEIRSLEALALFEAMRVGALANVVAGTIHGDSPYGVFDRLVNDLQVPRTSFKAADIIIIANPIRTADGLHKKRRIVSITEVRKEWEKDPLKENGFVELMKYNPTTDQLEFTDNLINGDSDILKAIASNVKEWAGNWDAIWDSIMLRASIKKTLVETSNKLKKPLLLEAGFVIKSNDEFHRISDEVREKYGYIDSKRIYFEWNEWLKKQIKLQNIYA